VRGEDEAITEAHATADLDLTSGAERYQAHNSSQLINRQPNANAPRHPLLGVKRTWRGLVSMSANDPTRTSRLGRQLLTETESISWATSPQLRC
jgi:hypothetical protein